MRSNDLTAWNLFAQGKRIPNGDNVIRDEKKMATGSRSRAKDFDQGGRSPGVKRAFTPRAYLILGRGHFSPEST